MTQTHPSSTLLTPARRRALAAAPVLIRIPDLSAARAPRRRGRRRLRREVRVAGSILLALLPASMLLACLGGDRPSRLAASSLTVAADPEPARAREAPAVSLSLEPVAATPHDLEAPVFLPGILLPVESTEEDADGRH